MTTDLGRQANRHVDRDLANRRAALAAAVKVVVAGTSWSDVDPEAVFPVAERFLSWIDAADERGGAS